MKKKTLKLKRDHHWKARPGHRIFVADRGAVRFDIPDGWVIRLDPESVKIFDGDPPDDNCRLELSYTRLPTTVDWGGFPLEEALRSSVEGDHRAPSTEGEVISVRRHDLRLAWLEISFDDPVEHRLAYSRILIGIGGNIQCLITFDFWEQDAARVIPAWDEVVRTLRLGHYVSDPTTGRTIIPHLQ